MNLFDLPFAYPAGMIAARRRLWRHYSAPTHIEALNSVLYGKDDGYLQH
jgi:hypothetical protein